MRGIDKGELVKQTAITAEFIEGAVSLEEVDGGVKPWRIPHEQRQLYYPEDGIQAKAATPAGVRVRFRARTAGLELHVLPDSCERHFDLVARDQVLATAVLAEGEERVRFSTDAEAERVYEVWLPTHTPVVLKGLASDSGVASVPDTRLRWVAYGSSITHCEAPNSPARAWPAVVSRTCALNLTCLGYGGNCMLEPLVGMLIRDLPADIITLKLGINVHGQSTLNARTFQPAVIGLVRLIREKHPQTPLGVITPIVCPMRETTRNAVARTLEDYRRDITEAVRRLRGAGDRRLWLFDGRELLGSGDAGHLHDGLHPDGDGYELIGTRAAAKVLPVLMDAAANAGLAC